MEKRDRPELGSSLVAVMDGVTGGDEGFPVELWRDDGSGRLMIRAYSASGFDFTEIDLNELIAWLSSAPGAAAHSSTAGLSSMTSPIEKEGVGDD